MRTGDLRDRVSIIRDTSSTLASGGKKLWTTYATVATVWAKCDPVHGGSEELAGSSAVAASIVRYGWWMRWRSDVTAKMRILWGTRQFNILAMPRGDRHTGFMQVVCEEVLR